MRLSTKKDILISKEIIAHDDIIEKDNITYLIENNKKKCEIICDDEKMSIRSIDKKLNLPEYKKDICWKEIEGIFVPRYGTSLYNNGITKQTIILKEGKRTLSFISHPSDLNFNDFEIIVGTKVPKLIYPKSYKITESMINRKLS